MIGGLIVNGEYPNHLSLSLLEHFLDQFEEQHKDFITKTDDLVDFCASKFNGKLHKMLGKYDNIKKGEILYQENKERIDNIQISEDILSSLLNENENIDELMKNAENLDKKVYDFYLKSKERGHCITM